MEHPLRGLQGGGDASSYSCRYRVGTPEEFQVENAINVQLPAGTITAYQYGGGGGFESPLLRDPGAVREDVLDEYVSVEAARDRYGVVVTGTAEGCDVEVDEDATRSLRAELAAARANGARG